MPFKYCYLLPILQAMLYPVAFTITYFLAAVVNEDVPPVFPYVSDTGVRSIERCIFSLTLCIGPLMMLTILYLRYRQVQIILTTNRERDFELKLKSWNKVSLYLSVGSVLGLLMVACFQVFPFLFIHLVGASAAFVFGTLALLIQTYLSFKLYPTFGNKYVNIARAILIGIMVITLHTTALFGIIGYCFFKGDDITQWTESSGGYQFHLASVFSEWILVLGTVLYLTLYTGEFRSIILHKPSIEIIKS